MLCWNSILGNVLLQETESSRGLAWMMMFILRRYLIQKPDMKWDVLEDVHFRDSLVTEDFVVNALLLNHLRLTCSQHGAHCILLLWKLTCRSPAPTGSFCPTINLEFNFFFFLELPVNVIMPFSHPTKRRSYERDKFTMALVLCKEDSSSLWPRNLSTLEYSKTYWTQSASHTLAHHKPAQFQVQRVPSQCPQSQLWFLSVSSIHPLYVCLDKK